MEKVPSWQLFSGREVSSAAPTADILDLRDKLRSAADRQVGPDRGSAR